ncbi:MAG: vanadium-dependent haloperoxidase [Planctomycetota bacterium]
MRIPYSEPDPAGSERAAASKKQRDLATEISRLQPHAITRGNSEEADHGAPYPANFTKGLAHDDFGVVAESPDYVRFVEAINSPVRSLFETEVQTAETREVPFACEPEDGTKVCWRGWESPRSGHVFDLQGPDPGAVGMAPAPRVGSSELAAEMAEVYGLALLRDVCFTQIVKGGGKKLCGSRKSGSALLTSTQIVEALNGMPFFSGDNITSSTAQFTDESGLNRFERNRRLARLQSTNELSPATVFRGSTPGAFDGPYVSQFLLVGATSLAGEDDEISDYPARRARFGLQDGYIPYGTLIIDQRTLTHKNCLDYMTDWCSWLDVQNGANIGRIAQYESGRRFITTPRDLATYVHFDALYEAYLNAGLIMLAMGIPVSKGFPERATGVRTGFATFGGPHILSLVTEVATRCLKAVRRQKFNYHRRARPEALGGRLTLSQLGLGGKLGDAAEAFSRTLCEIPGEIRDAVIEHNAEQNTSAMKKMRELRCKCKGRLPCDEDAFEKNNLLLPMAFPEGSPMHPAYGAGHATVAGGCVTMLKAFFEMYTESDSGIERTLGAAYVPTEDGKELTKAPKTKKPLTIQGELDKLAANISIGRNMAGVHYYSDYYDSIRMGERVAVGILLEQAPTYGEAIEMTFKSFDGDLITISGEGGSCPSLSILNSKGTPTSPQEWWLRHVPGEEIVLDN